MKNAVKSVVKTSAYFRASFPEDRGTAKSHQKFHGIFHGDFHARFQEKISRQHFCKPCRGEFKTGMATGPKRGKNHFDPKSRKKKAHKHKSKQERERAHMRVEKPSESLSKFLVCVHPLPLHPVPTSFAQWCQ